MKKNRWSSSWCSFQRLTKVSTSSRVILCSRKILLPVLCKTPLNSPRHSKEGTAHTLTIVKRSELINEIFHIFVTCLCAKLSRKLAIKGDFLLEIRQEIGSTSGSKGLFTTSRSIACYHAIVSFFRILNCLKHLKHGREKNLNGRK